MQYVLDPAWPSKPASIRWGDACGVSVDAQDRVYFCSRNAPHVQVYDAEGRFLLAWPDIPVDQPHHVQVDPEGNVWFADFGRHTVRKFTPDGEWGVRGEEPGQFVLPHAIASDSRDRLYVADRNSARIQVFDSDGSLLDVWAGLIMPWGIVAAADDHIWVCGSSPLPHPETDGLLVAPPPDQFVLKLTLDGRVAARWDFPKGTDGREKPGDMNWVHCIALDSAGALYLGDIKGQRLQKFVRGSETTAALLDRGHLRQNAGAKPQAS